MSSDVPSVPDLVRIAVAAVSNARDHLEGAHVLLETGLWPQSHAVATLALEELGKAHLCVVTMQMPPEYLPDLDFRKVFKDHNSKLAYASMMWVILRRRNLSGTANEILREMAEEASLENGAKFRALYVDYDAHGVKLPSAVNEEIARATYAKACELVRYAHAVYSYEVLCAVSSPTPEARAVMDDLIAQSVAAFRDDPDSLFPSLRSRVEGWRENVPPLELPQRRSSNSSERIGSQDSSSS